MKRTGISLFGAMVFLGCASQAPLGGRYAVRDEGYEPFTRPAAVRTIVQQTQEEKVTDVTVPPGSREKLVNLAKDLVGKPKIALGGKRYPDDCTGLIRGLFAQVNIDVFEDAQTGDNGVTAIYRFATRHGRSFRGGRPLPGDLVFFKETYDLNRDGRVNDGLTHVGLVESLEEDGTVVVIHRVARGVVRYRMNLEQPTMQAAANGSVLNDYLRERGTLGKPRLTGELFFSYATVLPVESRFAHR
jgi:hypothetical protein